MQTCSICSHPKRKQIEAAIAAGGTSRPIASQFGVGYKAVQRHIKDCIKPVIHLLEHEQNEQGALNVRERLLRDLALIEEALEKVWSEKGKNLDLLLRVLSESRQQNKLAAEWQRDTAVDQMQERLNALEQKMNDLYRARTA